MTRHPYEYALIRVIPDLRRGEVINAGVILYSQHHDHLSARTHLDRPRLHALHPHADAAAIEDALAAIEATCHPTAPHGPAADQPRGQRFRWLTAPRSTTVQPGPIHTGLTHDPDAESRRLTDLLVLPPPPD
ncbi:DUF3037 domain-containing protein [Nocardiopsis ansamitocini]|uniref:DUF3037 domain-containing protein n=1 Tax=Nocardiopsis ansamitocini TaxID=1670832 RepID=A0A9W6P722_9ACTN|nr:DUF3037 domain-containing protein [Nocardiopsis ansamitocini]GLU48188.1 hypothetical protein Nans01_25390 [Nocardiopsis ansamitocini]